MLFQTKVLRPDVTKAVTFLNNRLHAQPESKPVTSKYRGLRRRQIRPAEAKVFHLLCVQSAMHNPHGLPIRELVRILSLPRGVVQSAIRTLVKSEYVQPTAEFSPAYAITTWGYSLRSYERNLLVTVE